MRWKCVQSQAHGGVLRRLLALSEVGVVAVRPWVAALSAIGALASIVPDTVVSREIRCGVGDALTVVDALDVALVTRDAVGRSSTIAAVLADQ